MAPTTCLAWRYSESEAIYRQTHCHRSELEPGDDRPRPPSSLQTLRTVPTRLLRLCWHVRTQPTDSGSPHPDHAPMLRTMRFAVIHFVVLAAWNAAARAFLGRPPYRARVLEMEVGKSLMQAPRQARKITTDCKNSPPQHLLGRRQSR